MVDEKKKEMLECFDGMCLFLANHGITKRDESAVAIRKLILQQKPEIDDMKSKCCKANVTLCKLMVVKNAYENYWMTNCYKAECDKCKMPCEIISEARG